MAWLAGRVTTRLVVLLPCWPALEFVRVEVVGGGGFLFMVAPICCSLWLSTPAVVLVSLSRRSLEMTGERVCMMSVSCVS